MDLRPFLPGATEWLCRYCNQKFWWHPGAKNYDRPTQCACGKHHDSTLITPLVTIEGSPNRE